MDHLPDLMRQAGQPEAHDSRASTAPDTVPDSPFMPSMREVDAPQQLLQGVPPSVPQQIDRNTAPMLAAGMKRSAADAGLDGDAAPDGKRLKVTHAAEPDAERLQEARPETPAPVISRKRNALDAELDEVDLPPMKTPRQDEPSGIQDRVPMTTTDCGSPPQACLVAQESGADAYSAAKEQVRQKFEKLSMKISPHLQSAFVGDLLSIQAWLETPGIDINEVDENGLTVLFAAVKGGSVDVVQAVLAMPGIDVNAKNKNGLSALTLAIACDSFELVAVLLEMPGIDVNAINKFGFSELTFAVSCGFIKVIQALLTTPGIDVNAINKDGLSALHFAVEVGVIEIVEALLAMPEIDINVTNEDGKSLLEVAVSRGSIELVKALLATPGIDVNATDIDGYSVLTLAVSRGSIEVVQVLLATPGIDVNAINGSGYSELIFAVFRGSIEVVQAFLATPSIDVNARDKDGLSALTFAARLGFIEIVQALLAVPGIAVSSVEASHICVLAAEKGDLRSFRLMMDRLDFEVNRRVDSHCSYLIIAAKNGHFPIIHALLAVPGIDVNSRDGLQCTALLAATQNSHHRIALALAAMTGIDVNAKCSNWLTHDGGKTALMEAAKQGNLALVHTLLAVETIEVNLTDKKGYTALMLAAYKGHFEIVRALLAMPGIDIEAWSDNYPEQNDYMDHYDRNGRSVSWITVERPRRALFSALSLAETTGRTEIVKALIAMPVSTDFVHVELHKSLLAGSHLACAKPGKKSAATPEKTYRVLHQILHPGSGTNSPVPALSPNLEQHEMQHTLWLEQKCTAISLGICLASDVAFLLQSTIPLPARCQTALATAIALGFTAGHYRNAPAPLWQPLLQTKAWLAGLAFGAGQSRQDLIELHAGICHQLNAMNLWNGFLNTVEDLRELMADPDNGHLDKLTLLGCATRDGDLPIIKTLIAMGANIHLRSPNGDAPILVAAKAGQWAACAELFSLGAIPVMVDHKRYPALYYIASAFARSETATPALAKLIRYLRLKNVRFDIPMPNPDEQDREKNPIVLVSDILFTNPESWSRFGKIIYGIADEPLPALPMAPAPQSQPSASSKAQVHAMFQSANAEAALAAWLDANLQHLHWRDPDNDQTLLHLATASQNIGLVRFLLNRGIARTQVDRAGQTAAQLLPADYMSSYTPAAKRIAELLR